MGNLMDRLIEKLDIMPEFPTELANPSFMDYMLERGYLEEISDRNDFISPPKTGREVWFKINRLPIHPNLSENYDLLSRWQSVLASLHTWDDKVLFLLQRWNGKTNIYIGINSNTPDESKSRCETALVNCMPGIDIKYLDGEDKERFRDNLYNATDAGAITGIPSFRKETQYGVLQTLDQLAFGVRDIHGNDVNFSLLVVAEPMNDRVISDTIAKFQKLGSDIHTEVRRNCQEQKGITITEGETTPKDSELGAVMEGLGGLVRTVSIMLPTNVSRPLYDGGRLTTVMGSNFRKEAGKSSYSKSQGSNYNESVGTEYLNKFAQYAERLTDKHCERLRNGRNLGFWNVGIYVLGSLERNVATVLGMLRSMYSGDDSYIEPVRIHPFKQNYSATEIIKSRNLIPLKNPQFQLEAEEEWHIFGKPYQYLSTPLNTQELSLVTSLPRKDVPGLRFVKTAVRFANNSGETDGEDSIAIGKIKDAGIVQEKNNYNISVNALVRHSLIVGGTGSGKTTTCKTIINDVLNRNIPVLIIEPAKDEYVRWAIARQEEGKDINIYMPGKDTFKGEDGKEVRIKQLKLNPFQPAAVKGADVDMLTRCEQFTALINASLPVSDVLPVIIDETIFTYLREQSFGDDFLRGEMKQLEDYPSLDGILPVAQKLLKNRGYSEEVSRGLAGALETRFLYLTRGKRGKILNVLHSTPWEDMFEKTTVINLSRIANPKDRALIMSILLLSIYEYRVSAFMNDINFQKRALKNELLHLTVVEEAHNVLSRPGSDIQGTGNPQQAVADLFGNMLSEIRAYGEGLMIVDQIPTKLIPDVIKNTNYKIVHRLTSADDCKVMEAALALRKDQEGVIPTLSQGDVIVSGDKDDAACWVKINESK
jgi:hypothetical protein